MQHPVRTGANVRLVGLCGLMLASCAALAGGSPLTLVRGTRLMIDARVNGVPVTALLDSAAEATILDRAFATRLKLGRGAGAVGHGSGRSTFDASLVEGVALEAAGLTIAGQTVAVADLSDVGHRLLGRRIDAILGRELFDAARLRIDIDGRHIEVVPRSTVPEGVRLALTTEHGVETFPVSVEDGQPVPATFDLGNGAEVLLSRAFADRARILTDGRPVREKSGGGLGGAVTQRVVVLRSLGVAGRRFTRVPAAVDPQPTAADVNVGVSILRHFLVTTDFAEHAIWLQARN